MNELKSLNNLQSKKGKSERQPLLANPQPFASTSSTAVDFIENQLQQNSVQTNNINNNKTVAARPDYRTSPETQLVDVENDNGGIGGGGGHHSASTSSASTFNDDSQTMEINKIQIDGGHEGNDINDPLMMRRNLEHPTSNLDTLIHLLKGNIGTGILAMPDAFHNAGLYVGLFGTLLMGIICTHCMHMLVKCSHELCRRCQVPSLSFSEVCYTAFDTGPFGFRRYAKMAKQLINIFLCITQLGFCCVYFVFVAVNLREVIAHYWILLDVRTYLMLLLLPMVFLNLLKNLKYLTPVSLLASMLTVTGLVITFQYILHDLPRSSSVKYFSSWAQLPLYFGTAIYAFEGIGVILPLENNMKTPQDFSGNCGVLNTGMIIVTCLYTAVGFFGYLKYGDNVQASITLNLPGDDLFAQLVRLMMALAIFFSYGLQFYVPINIMGPWLQRQFHTERAQQYSDIALRVGLIFFTFILAAIIPNLGPIISLVGAVSSSTLALIFPPIIEIVTFWPNNLGKHNWILWKDLFIMIFGVSGFIFGTYTSVGQIINPPPQAI